MSKALLATLLGAAMFCTPSFAKSQPNCATKLATVAQTAMENVDSTGHFQFANPYAVAANVIRYDVTDYSAFGTIEYSVDITTNGACAVIAKTVRETSNDSN